MPEVCTHRGRVELGVGSHTRQGLSHTRGKRDTPGGGYCTPGRGCCTCEGFSLAGAELAQPTEPEGVCKAGR